MTVGFELKFATFDLYVEVRNCDSVLLDVKDTWVSVLYDECMRKRLLLENSINSSSLMSFSFDM